MGHAWSLPEFLVAILASVALVLAWCSVLIGLSACRRMAGAMGAPVQARRRFRWGALAICLAIAVAGLAAIWTLTPARYTASGLVLVDSPYPRAPMRLSTETPVPPDVMDRYVADQAALLTDDAVLRDTLMDGNVMNTPWYRAYPNKSLLLEELKDSVRVAQVPNTSYLRVAFTAPDPKEAASIVDTLIDKYLARVQVMYQVQYQSELQDYKQRERELSERLDRIGKEKDQLLAQTNSLVFPELLPERVRALSGEIVQLESQKLRAKAEYEALNGGSDSEKTLTREMLTWIEQDPEVARLQDTRAALEREMLILAPKPPAATQPAKGPPMRSNESGDAASLRARLDATDRQLMDLRFKKKQEAREYQAQEAYGQYTGAVQVQAELQERLVEAEARQRDLDKVATRMKALEKDEQLVARELDQIRDYTNQLQAVLRDRGMVRVHRIGQAQPPASANYGIEYAASGLVLLGLALVTVALATVPFLKAPPAAAGADQPAIS